MKYIDDEFGIIVEYWSGDRNSARAYWNYGTDWMFGGPPKPGYFIEIKSHGSLSNKIHGWIRLVRPFKGPYGPGNIVQFWKTGMTGQEKEIIEEVKNVIRCGGPGPEFEKGRLEIRARRGKKTKEEEQEFLSKLNTIANKRFKKDVLELSKKQQDEVIEIYDKKVNRTRKPRKKVEADGTLHEAVRKERQKIRTRKAAPKIAIAIVCTVIIAGVFVLGDGGISLPDISLPDISLPDISGCKTLDSVIITGYNNKQDEIYLKLCGKYITVSGDLHKNTIVKLQLRNPDGNSFVAQTESFRDKIDYKIPTETVEKDRGTWKILIYVNGKYLENRSLDIPAKLDGNV